MKLSVIVPVYNVEHYLPACFEFHTSSFWKKKIETFFSFRGNQQIRAGGYHFTINLHILRFRCWIKMGEGYQMPEIVACMQRAGT